MCVYAVTKMDVGTEMFFLDQQAAADIDSLRATK